MIDWDPLTKAQLHNLSVRFQRYTDARELKKLQLMRAGSHASYKTPAGKRVYGVLVEVRDDGVCKLKIPQLGRRGDRFETLSLDRLKLRVERLSKNEARRWALEEMIVEGVSRVRMEFRQWNKMLRLQKVITQFEDTVMSELPEAFKFVDFVSVAEASGLASTEGRVFLFEHLLQSRAIRPRPGNPGRGRCARTYRKCS